MVFFVFNKENFAFNEAIPVTAKMVFAALKAAGGQGRRRLGYFEE
jgi:hypothetical protein